VIKMPEGKMILIAAVADNGVIGRDGKVPWERISEDMKRFRKLTMDHAVLMGRKTYESLGKPLDGRLNVVITRNNYLIPNTRDVVTFNSLDNAIGMCRNFRKDGDFYVIGGAEIYKQTINLADALDITHVHQNPEGDAFFPEIDKNIWFEIERKDCESYSFATYVRKND